MGALVGFFAGPLGKWIVIGLLFFAGIAYGFVKGNAYGTAKLDAYVAEQMREETRIAAVRTKITREVVVRYIEKADKTEIQIREVKVGVENYARTNPDGLCIDAEWTRLHNAAAEGAVPRSGLRIDGSLRAPFLDPEGLRFYYRVPGTPSRDGELREASSLRGSAGLLAGLGY